jgi:NADPH:quinone reductase-like Zn-dependent oxidoreductase
LIDQLLENDAVWIYNYPQTKVWLIARRSWFTGKAHMLTFYIRTHHNMIGTMKSAIISIGPKVEIRDVPIPSPGPGEVLVKVVYSGSNPKDWKVYDLIPDLKPSNQGNDFAGVIEALGERVTEFRVGDRVAAFSTFAGGSYAEYAVAPALTTFMLPNETTFKGVTSFCFSIVLMFRTCQFSIAC